MATQQRTAGRFASALDDVQLIRLIGRIAQLANEADPVSTTQVAYDRARADHSFAEAPTAAASARRLGMAWPALLEVACDPERDPQMTLAALRRPEPEEVSLEEAVMALRIVSVRLGGAPLNPGRYEAERQAMITADPRRHHAAAAAAEGELGLPSVGQLERLGAFGELLQVAGLDHGADAQPDLGVPVGEALERFLTEQGFLISYVLLCRWANVRGFRVERLRPRSYLDVAAELRANRAARGLWTPERPTPKNERVPDLQPRDGDEPLGPRQRTWSYEQSLDALVRAMAELPPGGGVLTQRAYRAIAKGRADLPSASVLSRIAAKYGTTFSAMREEARQRSQGPAGPSEIKADDPVADSQSRATRLLTGATNKTRMGFDARSLTDA